MKDESDKLVAMANQIASFFGAYPQEEAAHGIRDHIVAFWTPGMRRAFDARIDRDPAAISPLVLRALDGHRMRAPSPIIKETADAATLGQLASDAG